ncbi:MAG: hypothetical protein JWO89_1019 [Verrucomicrobiaceae bacterium]|nr:hypothetical protein [Verrucomicrobiaceae bacterium]
MNNVLWILWRVRFNLPEMQLSPRESSSNLCHRVLVISDAPTVQSELAGIIANPKPPEASAASRLSEESVPVEYAYTANGDQGASVVETAVRQVKPVAVVIIDWRVFHGSDCTPLVKRMWNAQSDLHVVVHSVFDQESRAHITARLGLSHRLLVLKQELTPFEMVRMAQTLTVKWKEERELSLLQAQMRIAPGAAKPEVEIVSLPPPAPARAVEKVDTIRQAHRLETVGRLTDGVAHDFNNFLTVIQGHLSVALADKANNEKLVSCVEEVLKEAGRVSEMTRQLLAFNHREYQAPRAILLEQMVDDEVNLLRKTLGEQVTIEVDHEADMPPVMADPASLGQAFVSLAVRARDAMPNGGKLSIHTRRIHIPNAMAAGLIHPEAKPGDYVVVALADGGKGMTSEQLARVFAAPTASSPGVGLVIVQELVRHQGGWVTVTSVPEVGTEFSIHLPAAKIGAPVQPVTKAADPELESKVSKEPSTILIVDDEDSVRQVMEFVLANQGHTVIAAKDANEGWSMWCKHSRTINLAIVDIKLPGGISGFDLERAIAEEDCTVPVVFTCGYCPSGMEQKKELKVGVNYLPKPFGMAELLNIVNKAMLQPAKF